MDPIRIHKNDITSIQNDGTGCNSHTESPSITRFLRIKPRGHGPWRWVKIKLKGNRDHVTGSVYGSDSQFGHLNRSVKIFDLNLKMVV